LHIGGYFYGTADFNPASGVTTKTSAGGADGYVTQLDNNGNFQSVTSFGGIENDLYGNLLAIRTTMFMRLAISTALVNSAAQHWRVLVAKIASLRS
jgi:hypothetical protein